MNNKKYIIIGFSGHAFVVLEALLEMGKDVKGYCDSNEKDINPYRLNYLGQESFELVNQYKWFVTIGNNIKREKIISTFFNENLIKIVHPTSYISKTCLIKEGSFISANASLNAQVKIGKGVIINTNSVIEHECNINDYAHIAPGSVLAGNVSIGKRSFIGANSVVKEGVIIGDDVIVGAGAVILKDIPDNVVVVGNPGKIIKANI